MTTMTCCLTQQELQHLADNQFAVDDVERINEHLESCARYADQLSELQPNDPLIEAAADPTHDKDRRDDTCLLPGDEKRLINEIMRRANEESATDDADAEVFPGW